MPHQVLFGSAEANRIAEVDRVLNTNRIFCPACFDGDWVDCDWCDWCGGTGSMKAWDALDYLQCPRNAGCREKYLNKLSPDHPVSPIFRSILKVGVGKEDSHEPNR